MIPRPGRFQRWAVRAAIVAAAVISVGGAFANGARAALAIHPTRTDDPGSGGGGVTCSFLPVKNTDCSLRNALALAGDGTTVSLAPPAPEGPYTLTQSALHISHNITLSGVGPGATTIRPVLGALPNDDVLTVDGGAAATVQGVTITGGSGGIVNAGTLTIRDTLVTQNDMDPPILGEPAFGGGINNSGKLTVIDSTVSDNTAQGLDPAGGGILNRGPLAVISSTVSGNAALGGPGGGAEGGGIAAAGDFPVTIANSTIAGNTAAGGGLSDVGGGILTSAGNVALASVTLAGNSVAGPSSFGGNLVAGDVASGRVTLKNTIIAGGTAGTGAENCYFGLGTVVSMGYNVEDRNQCRLSGPDDQVNSEPLLGSLRNNGGPTETEALALGSPAVDHGDPAGCTDPNGVLLIADQRGLPRPPGAGCDVGAYELQLPPDLTLTPTDAISADGSTLGGAIDTHGFATTWHFEYGPTSAYGSSTPARTLATGAQPVRAAITGLRPDATYHIRLVATDLIGTSQTSDQTFTTTPSTGGGNPGSGEGGPGTIVPTITAATQSHRRWREANKLATISRAHKPAVGTTFSLQLNEPALLSFAFSQTSHGCRVHGRCVAQTARNRRGRACTRTLTSGSLSLNGHSGLDALSFYGRLTRAHKLKPGSYTLSITATDADGRRSDPAQLRFTIVTH